MQPETFKHMDEITTLQVPKVERAVFAVLPGNTKLVDFDHLHLGGVVALNVEGGLFLCQVMCRDESSVVVKFADDTTRRVLPYWPSFRGARTVTETEQKLWEERSKIVKE